MKQIPLAIGPEPSQTFENFLPGANAATLAHLLALAPGAPPVYLWGPEGSGKTHLLHAVVGRAASHGQQAAWYSAATAAPWSEAGERDWLVFDDAHALVAAQPQAAFSLFVDATGRGAGVAAENDAACWPCAAARSTSACSRCVLPLPAGPHR